MLDFLFYLFAALALGSSFLVVLSRNAVNSAMFMILTFVSTAALFFVLEAFFLGVLQILVYAGAVMVLFLFIIMLLDTDDDRARRIDRSSLFAASVIALALAAGTFQLFTHEALIEPSLEPVATEAAVPEAEAVPAIADPAASDYGLPLRSESRGYGYGLMTKYLLPVQVSGFLLLSALLGVVLISKRLGASGEEAPEAPATAAKS